MHDLGKEREQRIRWRRKWQPTPVILPGKSHGQRSLVGYNPWGHKESDTTERLTHTHTHTQKIRTKNKAKEKHIVSRGKWKKKKKGIS